jgi:16S rRNA G527 N7-methylase RsmG
MVEVRERKAAFLREVTRSLRLNATVEAKRFEEIAVGVPGSAALVTVRAVRPSAALWATAGRLLQDDGILAYFSGSGPVEAAEGFEQLQSIPLAADGRSQLSRMRRVPRETSIH